MFYLCYFPFQTITTNSNGVQFVKIIPAALFVCHFFTVHSFKMLSSDKFISIIKLKQPGPFSIDRKEYATHNCYISFYEYNCVNFVAICDQGQSSMVKYLYNKLLRLCSINKTIRFFRVIPWRDKTRSRIWFLHYTSEIDDRDRN